MAVISTSFLDPSHDHIGRWIKGLLDAGIDIHIFTETRNLDTVVDDGLTASFFAKRVHLLNDVYHPWKIPPENYVRGVFSFLRPAWMGYLLYSVKKYERVKRRIFKKVLEYLPWHNMQFDLVHFNYPKIALRRFELGELFQSKTLTSFRGQDLTFYPGLFSSLFKQCTWFHFISEHLRHEAQSQGLASSNYSVIPPMVDTEYYRPANLNKPRKGKRDRWIFYTAARLYWLKGFEYVLQALKILIDEGWMIDYYISGEGEHFLAIDYAINDLGLREHVHLLGWSSPEVKREWMQKADLYLLGSVSEGFNNSVLQAQACGLPVVCTDAGGLPENVEDGVSGLIARRRDPQDFSSKIQYLLENPELLALMRINARVRAEHLFSIDKVVQQFVNLYHHIENLSGRC
ncbi:glycosyltransferase family 4 protein [Anaerolinea sp.]|uniref:glycosyltransferase family 4 protein n=1 Tax=Anaerolinea sp. TaxID=1872519 RepID=UPI002ACDF806|nr:glycosyltransferase family 4 protein [Anaerolinea sp.]